MPFSSVGHGVGVQVPSFQTFCLSYEISTFDSITPVFEHKCFAFHTGRQPPMQRQRTLNIRQLYQAGLAPATYRNQVPAKNNTENCSHPFSGLLALSITSQVHGYTRTDERLSLSWRPSSSCLLPLKEPTVWALGAQGWRNTGYGCWEWEAVFQWQYLLYTLV